MSGGKVLLSVLAGVAAGALIGILFAPDKGSETRRKIMQKGEDLANSAKDTFDDVVGSVNQRIDQVKEGISNVTRKAKETADEAKNTAKSATA
jgi:gas vesicle protein